MRDRPGHSVVVLADVLETAGRAIVAVADNHAVLNHKGTHLSPLAVTILRPYPSHLQIAQVKLSLLF